MPRWLADSKQWVENDAGRALRDFRDKDLRYSYLIIGAMVVVGLIVNWLFAHSHGWTVWPFVFAAGILLDIHEAAERNGTGVPPLQVYGLFGGALAIWVVLMAILSVTNPLILLLGIAWIGYMCGIQLSRIASTIASANRGGHARSVLTQRTAAADASAKERALLASRPRQSTNRQNANRRGK